MALAEEEEEEEEEEVLVKQLYMKHWQQLLS
jgi:hypothetical protein